MVRSDKWIRTTGEPWNGPARAAHGVIVTGRLPDGRIVARHGAGEQTSDGLRAAVAGLVEVLTISTPTSILRDLQGTRAALDVSGGFMSNDGGGWSTASAKMPEPQLLGQIGRMDLWRPRDDAV